MPLTFLHPGLFALGVACVSIPIILHLLKRKRRPIPWAAMRFLEQAYRKRRRRMTIEQLIMLALRCSLIVLIAAGVGAIMLGQPSSQSGPNTLTIIIDNSIGSALIADGQMSIDAYKQAAIAQLDTLDPAKGDRAALIIGAKPARALVLPASSDFAELTRLINEIQPTDSMFDLQGSVNLAAHATMSSTANSTQEPQPASNHILLIATNARGSLHETNSNTITDGFDQIISPHLPSQIINNIGIQSSSPMRSLVTRTGLLLPMNIRVELLRTGNLAGENQSTTITITDPENNVLGARTVQWADGQSQLDAIVPINPQQLRANNTQAALLKVQIDNDANQRDNHRLVAIPSVEAIRVGVLDRATDLESFDKQTSADLSPARWIKAALSPAAGMGIEIKVFDASRASSLLSPRLDAAIVLAPAAMNESGWRRLKELNESGMMVIIAQDAQSESTSWVQHANALLPPATKFLGLVENLDTPARLNSSMNIDDHSIIAELRNEYPDLAKPVIVNRFMHMQETSEPDSSQVRTILQLSTGKPIIEQIKHTENQGTLVTLAIAIDLQWTNLPARGLFVPLMQELIREGVGKSVSIPSKIAGNQSKNPPWVVSTHRLDSFPTFNSTDPKASDAGILALVDPQGTTRGISLIHPDTRSAKTNPTDQQSFTALIAKMTGNNSNDQFKITWLDTNLASSDESPIAKASLNPANTNNQLALWMLFGACIIALIETTLAKLFSVKLEQAMATEARE